jgi:hypothetical protein
MNIRAIDETHALQTSNVITVAASSVFPSGFASKITPMQRVKRKMLLAVVEASTVALGPCMPDCTLLIIFGKRAVQSERTVAPRRAADILNDVAREEVECDMTKLEMERAINPMITLTVLSSIPLIICPIRDEELAGRSGVDSDSSITIHHRFRIQWQQGIQRTLAERRVHQ